MRWILALGIVGAVIWLYMRPIDEAPTDPGPAPQTAPDEKAPELLQAPRLQPGAQPAPAPPAASPQDKPAAPPPQAPAISFWIHGVVKRAGTDEVLREAQVVARYGLPFPQRDSPRELPTESDGLGRFKIHVTNPEQIPARWALKNPNWRVTGWQRDDDPKRGAFDPMNEKRARYDVTLWAYETFMVRGIVEDENGHPLPGATVAFAIPMNFIGNRIHLGSQQITTEADGRFEAGPLPAEPKVVHPALAKRMAMGFLSLTVRSKGSSSRVIDPYKLDPDQRDDLRITLTKGAVWTGILVDEAGAPLPDVVVEMRYGDQWRLRRATRTNAEGRWRLERLSPGKATLLARAFDHDAKAKQEVEVDEHERDLRLVAERLDVPTPDEVMPLFGLELVAVDDKIRAAFELSKWDHVMIWKAGANTERLGVGTLRRGYGVQWIGDTHVKSLPQAVQLLSMPAQKSDSSLGSSLRRRLVYSFWSEKGTGTNTQYLNLNDDDRAQVARLDTEYKDRYPKQDKPASQDK